jgi:hypothetical protein
MRQSGNRSIVRVFLLALVLVPLGAVASEKVYISVDESGTTTASDRPPESGVVEEEVALPESAPQSDTERAQQEIKRIQQKADQMGAERKQKEQERAAAKDEKQRREAACAASRSRLEQLQSQPPNRRLVVNPDGSAHRVTAEEMEDLLSAAKRQVVEDCGSLEK